ncbi:MAG: CRISPR-associated helicase Cas3', partial [Sarcina sp.]
ILKEKNIEKIFKNIENECLNNFTLEAKKYFRTILLNTIHFHDIGKIAVKFQKNKMDNNEIDDSKEIEMLGSKHSILSSILYIDNFIEELEAINNKNERKILRIFLYLNAYLISRHHSDLDSFGSFIKKFNVGEDAYNIVEAFKVGKSKVYLKELNLDINDEAVTKTNAIARGAKKIEKDMGLVMYTYQRLLLSLIFASDFYATSEFMSGSEITSFGSLNNIDEFYDVYKEGEIYKSIRNYEDNMYGKIKDFSTEKNINVLRTEMFLEAEQNFIKNKNENIFYLEAPTGCGKSNVSMNLSFKMMEEDSTLQKIFYIYPFNTLIEQNKKIIDEIFKNEKDVLENIAVINSITSIKVKEMESSENEYLFEDDFVNYTKSFLDRQFLNYPFILTTNVGLFNTMFSSRKEDIFPFHQLANSIIILDEIQSYKISIWTEIITFLKSFSKVLNLKIVIMSATLPNLNSLIDDSENVNLIENREKYFENHLFKNRVNISYELMESDFEEIIEHVVKASKMKKKILIEFISKITAYKFFEALKEFEVKCPIFLLTGDDHSIDREKIIQMTKSKKISETGLILVSTQIIEAGVDIDMDLGYKDTSKFDSEEQFMGRINRSCKREGVVYFFNIYNAEKIYKNDVRVEKSLTINLQQNLDIRNALVNKDFESYYKKVLARIKEENGSGNEKKNVNEFFQNAVGKFDFIKIEEKMKIIDEDFLSKSIFLARDIKDLENNIISGEKIWNEYKVLLSDNKINYAKKKIKMSEITAKMNYFIYKVSKKCDIPYDDKIGDLIYIQDAEKYFIDNKLNKDMLESGIGDFV